MSVEVAPASPAGQAQPEVSTSAATNASAATANGTKLAANGNKPAAKRRGKGNRPNYALIHSKPLPLTTYPLPDFHPTNPLSLLRLAYTIVSQYFSPPPSHPSHPYQAFLSLETRAVHVTDPVHVRALWEMGFFGKGTLSRSEPSWMEREKARLKAKRSGGKTAEEVTMARREERKMFKLERARLEREKIERQRLVEEGKLSASALEEEAPAKEETTPEAPAQAEVTAAAPATPVDATTPTPAADVAPLPPAEVNADAAETISARTPPAILPEILDQEHLQLTLEEAFFLIYALGVLSLQQSPLNTTQSSLNLGSAPALLQLFCNLAVFPTRPLATRFAPDDQFLLSYVTYHHFRSLGWVIRPGIKFGVDYMVYHRGPAFTHAEFAVVVVPAYTAPYWKTEEGQAARRVQQERDWWSLHCTNRVQSQVFKSLVLVYVDVPPPREEFEGNVGKLLRAYTVREFVVKRWLQNRSRD